MKHILSSAQFERETLEDMFIRADFYQEQNLSHPRRLAGKYIGNVLCALFYQPSTRTRLSFESAAARLGMGVISSENAGDNSSAIKGENLKDAIKVINGYADIIVLRHPEPGSAEDAALVSNVPIINGGDGGNEHPTQAAIDAYTINEQLGMIDGLHVAFGGDLKYGRTVRSLVDILSRTAEGNSFSFIAPDELQISPDIESNLQAMGVRFVKTSEMKEGLHDADVVYWTRVQEENMKEEAEKQAVREIISSGKYNLDVDSLSLMPDSAKIMHPLPKVGEIDPGLDDHPQAIYIKQAHNGLQVRQALIEMIMEDA